MAYNFSMTKANKKSLQSFHPQKPYGQLILPVRVTSKESLKENLYMVFLMGPLTEKKKAPSSILRIHKMLGCFLF